MEIEAWRLWQKWGVGGTWGGDEGSRGRERPRRHTYTLEHPASPRSLARLALRSPSVPTREDVARSRALQGVRGWLASRGCAPPLLSDFILIDFCLRGDAILE